LTESCSGKGGESDKILDAVYGALLKARGYLEGWLAASREPGDEAESVLQMLQEKATDRRVKGVMLGLLVEPRLAVVEILLLLERSDEAMHWLKTIEEEDVKGRGLRYFEADLSLLHGRRLHLERQEDQAEAARP